MTAKNWGYMLKNYVGPDCLEKLDGFVLHKTVSKTSLQCPRGTWSCQALLAEAGSSDFPILNTSECWFPAKSPLAIRLLKNESGDDGPRPSAAIYEQCLQPPLVFLARAPPEKVQSAWPSIPENYLCDANDGGDPKYFYHATTAAATAIVDWDNKARSVVDRSSSPAPSVRHPVQAGVQRHFPL